MRIRIVMSGIIAGGVCISALWLPWYMVWPADFTVDWEYFNYVQNFPGWLETGSMIFCGVALFAFGWTAARWNWEKNWRDSLLAGGGMGLIAGCLIYDFIGAFHYGLLGQKDVLAYFYVTLTETQGLTMMANAFFRSAGYIFQSFFLLIGASTGVGALGGLASALDLEDVWGSAPRVPEQWLFRVPAYTLVISGYLCYMVVFSFIAVMQNSMNDLLGKINTVDVMGYLFFIKFYLLAMMATFFPLGITWGWIIRAWRGAKLWRVLYTIWVAATLYQTGRFFVYYFQIDKFTYSYAPNFQTTYYEVILSSCALGAGIALGLFSGSIPIPDSKYSFSDWLGYLLGQGIIGGTQVFASLPAYALVTVAVTVQNTPHLTNTGLSTESIANQVLHLSQYLNIAVGSGIGFCIFGGIIVSGVVTAARKFLKIMPRNIPPDAPVFMD